LDQPDPKKRTHKKTQKTLFIVGDFADQVQPTLPFKKTGVGL
jgi:hypothetical protein